MSDARDASPPERGASSAARVEPVRDYAIFTADPQGRATSWNQGVKRILGFEEADFVGRDVTSAIFTPEDVSLGVPQNELETAARMGTADNTRWMRRKSGEHFYATGITTALRDATGSLIGFTKVLRDETEKHRVQEELRRNEAQLAADLADIQLLHALSHAMAGPDDSATLYEHVLDAATTITRAAFATLQRFHPERGDEGELQLLSHRGCTSEAAAAWGGARDDTACARALRTGRRCVVVDVEELGRGASAETVELHRSCGIRGVMTTPLVSRSGKLLGLLSTGWKEPHEPSEREQRLLDIVARQAADLIERAKALTALHESEERLLLALEGARMVGWQWHPATDRILASENLADVFGFPTGAVVDTGAQVFERIHPDDREPHRTVVRKAVEDCGTYVSRYRLLRPIDGTILWIEERGRALCDTPGTTSHLVGVASDVTSRVEMEEMILAQSEAIAGESRRKDEFLAMLSHELRNPLAPITAALHLLRVPGETVDASTRERAVEVIGRQVENLTKLVNDLLDVSRVLSGRIRLDERTLDAAVLVRRAIETIRPTAEAGRHELVLRAPPDPAWVRGDATRLEEVFVNLLHNAAKFTARPGRIEIDVEPAPEEERVAIRVRDEGVGIDPELLPRIFDLFTQADHSLARSAGGLGVGLSLARRLVELHGGTIDVRSPPAGASEGSEFVVVLPRTPAPDPRDAPAAIPPALPARRARILVVDDNADLVSMMATALRRLGHRVESARDGPAALEAARRFRPEIVLLDIGLPGLDGYEIARRLRRADDPALRAARLVALTGYGRESDVARAREAGFDDHVVKPVDVDALADLVASRN